MEQIFSHIKSLPFEAEESSDSEKMRELRVENNILVVDVFSVEPSRIHGVFGKGRELDVPKIRRGARSRKIPLKAGEYIENPSHFVIFEDGLVVFEKNPHGPALSSFGTYIRKKCPELIKSSWVNRVPKGEFLDRFQRTAYIRKFAMKLGVRGIRRLSLGKEDSFMTGLEKHQRDIHFETAYFELSMRHSPGGIIIPFREKLVKILEDPEKAKDILRLEVKARMIDSGEIEVMRLLPNISMERTVNFKLLPKQTEPNREEVFTHIYRAFNSFKRELERRGDDDYKPYYDMVQEELDSE
jgi:hypothetical protein